MHSNRLHTQLLLAFDLLAVVVLFNLVAWLRGIAGPGQWILAPLFIPSLFVCTALYLIDGYRSRTEMMSADYTSQHAVAVLFAMLATLLLTYAIIPSNFPLQGSRAVIALAFLLLGVVTLSYRRSMHRWVQVGRRERFVLFLGDRASCAKFQEICRANGMDQRILLAVTGEATEPPMHFGDAPSIRSFREVVADIRADQIEVEAIVLRESGQQLPGNLADELTELFFDGVPTYTLELFFETYWRKIPLYRINHVWLFQEGFQIARNPVFERLKRTFDIVTSLLGLVLATPPMLLAAIAIKVSDPGPVFFRQSRIGRNRRPFQILKLRTMRTGPAKAKPTPPPADEASPPAADLRYTQQNDPRITAVGGFLRKSRLDEVPQLWNVLKGEMSLIGPRAEWDQLVRDYETSIPCYHFRHLVRPGITGWAQINYPYGASVDDTLRKLEYDLYYIRHFSFVMDASIVLRTINLMLFGKGR